MSDSTQDASGDETQNASGDQNDTSDDPSQDSQNSDSQGDSGSSEKKNWLEWSVTIAGAVLVLFVVGFLAYSWATSTDEPADLRVSLDAPRANGSTMEIPVTVQNEGPRVAEAAVIEVCAGPENCGQLTFDYVPFKSKVDGAVGLEAPLEAQPTSRVVSFRNP